MTTTTYTIDIYQTGNKYTVELVEVTVDKFGNETFGTISGTRKSFTDYADANSYRFDLVKQI